MKKVWALFMIFAILISLFACDNNGENSFDEFVSSEGDDESLDASYSFHPDDESDNSYILNDESGEDSSLSESEIKALEYRDAVRDGEYEIFRIYGSWERFLEFHAEDYEALLNPEKLNTVKELIVYQHLSTCYYVGSDKIEGRETEWLEIKIQPLDDSTMPIWKYSLGYNVNKPTKDIDLFCQNSDRYTLQYTKEGVDVYYSLNSGQQARTTYDVFMKMGEYIISVSIDKTVFEKLINAKDFPTEKECEALKPMFEDAMWKYELLNVYNEDSQLVALLKEMVAEQTGWDGNNYEDPKHEKEPSLPLPFYSWEEFVESEGEDFVKLLNPEKLNSIDELEIFYNHYDYYYGVASKSNGRNFLHMAIIPLEDSSQDLLKILHTRYLDFLVPPVSTNLNMFPMITYPYEKEGVEMYLFGDVQRVDLENGNTVNDICDLYAACKIGDFAFVIVINVNVNDSIWGERRFYYEEKMDELKSEFGTALWNYELLNIHDDESQLVALLKEMVAEQS